MKNHIIVAMELDSSAPLGYDPISSYGGKAVAVRSHARMSILMRGACLGVAALAVAVEMLLAAWASAIAMGLRSHAFSSICANCGVVCGACQYCAKLFR